MQKRPMRNTMIVVAGAVAIIALFTAAAFAAPVLPPGTTSAPGMSGTCTDCHTYASAPSSTPATLTGPSHPYTAKATMRVKKTFKTWGYIPSSVCGTSNATATIQVQRLGASGKWKTVASLATTATLSDTGKFKNATNYSASLKIARTGNYRMRTKLVYLDSSDAAKTKWSTWKRFTMRK